MHVFRPDNRPDGSTDNMRRVWLPYCIHEISPGRWLLLNRFYKPIGTAPRVMLDYGKFQTFRIDMTPELRAAIAYPRDDRTAGKNKSGDDGNWIYLYFDGNIPFRSSGPATTAYLRRLDALQQAIDNNPANSPKG